MRSPRLAAVAALIAAGVVAAAVMLPATGTAQTAPAERDTVTVVAVGTVEGRPDLAVVHLGIAARALTAQAAMEELARRQNAVIDALENGLGLADDQVRTGNITLRRNCRYDRTRDRTVCSGYVARTSIRAETKDLDQVGAIIDAALEAGANSLNGVSFERTEKDEALREALVQAMDLARAKADTLARSGGRALGRVMVIEEGGARRPVFLSGAADAAGGFAGEESGPVIDPSDSITRVVISVTFALD